MVVEKNPLQFMLGLNEVQTLKRTYEILKPVIMKTVNCLIENIRSKYSNNNQSSELNIAV